MRFVILFALFICFFRVAASAQEDITLTGIECALTSELEHLQEQNDANEQLERTADDDLSHIERRFSELSLAIYHQDYENFFFLSYYSSQVAQLNNYFFSNHLPYYRMGQKVQREITRQQALRKALTLAQARHTSPETRAQLTRCLALNEQLLALYTARQVKINAQKARFVRLSGRITALDIYANGKAVAKDESHYEDNIGPEQMISTLFEDEAAEGSEDKPEQKPSAAQAGVEEERLTPADFVNEDLPSAVLARRLVQQLIDPYSITTSLDEPENGYSYWAQLRQFPQRFAAQYFPKAGNPSLETVREIIAFFFLFGGVCIGGYYGACYVLRRATKRSLSPNRQRGGLCALSLALYGTGMVVFAHSDVVEQPFLSEHLTNFGTYIVLSGLLIFTLSIRLATPRISNGLGLFLPLILCNAAQLLFSVFMSDNGTVLALSPLIYLVSALCTAWYFLFRMRRLRILFRVFGLMSVVLLFCFSYGSYLGYVYVMMLLSLSWYLFLISFEVLACVSSCCRVLVRKLASLPQLRDYRSYITLWLHLFTRYLILPMGFLIVMWYSLDWPANCLNLAHYLETWISMEYEFNTIIKSLSAGLVLHMITVGIVTNCILRLVQRTLIELHAHKPEGGGQLTLVTVLSLVVWLSYIIYCLMLMKANYESILVILGGMSVGIGLGLKDNIENFISGISLMLGRLRVGDTVECGVYRGRVTSIGFRTTTIETFCGSTIIFQNKELFNDKFRNMTHNNQYERRVITVGIAYGTDIDHARRVILGALAPLTDLVSQQHPYYVALSNFGASSIDLSVYVWLPVQGRPLGRSTVREAIYRALTKNDISIPFPQQDLYIKQAPEEPAAVEESCPRFPLS